MSNDKGLDIFISVSLKYPELNAVKYQADEEKIYFELALIQNIDKNVKEIFLNKLKNCLIMYHKITSTQPSLLDLSFHENGGVNFLRVQRDIKTICEEEIELLLLMVSEEFNNYMLQDNSRIVIQDSLKKRLKKNLLKKINTGNAGANNFLAYRQEGKVMVFNS
ncbi:MAG: hypothetical protein PHC92_00320 [Syntrophomonadaceae bacterium]|nr:hypothetical protein [Syntrophomonadaceae bacterium]MDD3022369.1 hypothetical protein [Syntrophomonadaceae bacterium]